VDQTLSQGMTKKHIKKIDRLVKDAMNLVNKQSREGADCFDLMMAYGAVLSTIIADSRRPDTSKIDCINTAVDCFRANLSEQMKLYPEEQPHGDN
jgi:hypothetical protein